MLTDTRPGSGPRLIALLKLVARGPQSFTLKEMSERAGLPPSTVHRLLQMLVQSGMVERGKRQSYRSGRELHLMASILRVRFDLAQTAKPFLDKLWSDWQETAVLCVYNPSALSATIADALLTPHPLRFTLETGMELALPWGSLGRAILAHLPEKEIESTLRAATTGPISGRPLPARDQIHSELARIRDQGFADYYDPSFDVAGVAAAIFDVNGRVLGCIGVTMPSQRFTLHDHAKLTVAVRDAASELTPLIAL